MYLGRIWGIPTYLTPRLAGPLVAALAVACLYTFTWRAFRSPAAGLVAGVSLASFGYLSRFSIVNLEPKALVMLFVLVTALALQRRRWVIAGLSAALAASCWQPAILVVLAVVAVGLAARREKRMRVAKRAAAGFVLGCLPSLAYVTVGGSWRALLQQGVALKAVNRFPVGVELDQLLFSFARLLYLQYQAELVLLVIAAAGFIWFVANSVDRRFRGRVSGWLHPRFGGVPILTLLAVGYTAIDVQGPPDLIPWLPLSCFWLAWSAVHVGRPAQRRLAGRTAAAGGRRRAQVRVALLAILAAYGLGDALLYSPEDIFGAQRRTIAALVERADREGRDGQLLAIGAPSVYAIAEQRSPWRYIDFRVFFDPLIEWDEPGGCDALLRRLRKARSSIVVYNDHPNVGRCGRRLHERLDAVYPRSDIRFRIRRSYSYTGTNDRHVWVLWRVYDISTEGPGRVVFEPGVLSRFRSSARTAPISKGRRRGPVER
jgi:hypothetical protein